MALRFYNFIFKYQLCPDIREEQSKHSSRGTGKTKTLGTVNHLSFYKGLIVIDILDLKYDPHFSPLVLCQETVLSYILDLGKFHGKSTVSKLVISLISLHKFLTGQTLGVINGLKTSGYPKWTEIKLGLVKLCSSICLSEQGRKD